MKVEKVIPILRIFDYTKAVEFYIDWLGFEIEWEHVFEEGMPKYIQIKREGIALHLSEHHGDTTPGTRIYVECTGLKEYHKELIEKKYKYNKPGLKKTFYNSLEVEVVDPFGNKISFNEKLPEQKEQ
jgi:uncharacterized glyoxalase superfamily protein PhnB